MYRYTIGKVKNYIIAIMADIELENKVKKVIDQLRPYLQADGGDLKFVEVTDENVVKVELRGACGSCPYSLMTLKDGLERAMKEQVPEITSVERV